MTAVAGVEGVAADLERARRPALAHSLELPSVRPDLGDVDL